MAMEMAPVLQRGRETVQMGKSSVRRNMPTCKGHQMAQYERLVVSRHCRLRDAVLLMGVQGPVSSRTAPLTLFLFLCNRQFAGPLTLSGGNNRSPGSWTPVSTPSLTTSGTLSSMGSSNDEVHAAAVLADGARLGAAASGNLDHYRISSAGDSAKASQMHSSSAAPYGAYKLS